MSAVRPCGVVSHDRQLSGRAAMRQHQVLCFAVASRALSMSAQWGAYSSASLYFASASSPRPCLTARRPNSERVGPVRPMPVRLFELCLGPGEIPAAGKCDRPKSNRRPVNPGPVPRPWRRPSLRPPNHHDRPECHRETDSNRRTFPSLEYASAWVWMSCGLLAGATQQL